MPLAAFPKCFLDQLCVTREMTVDQWIDLSSELDVDGLEFYWGFTPWENPAELDRIRRRVEEQGRSIPMMCYSSDFTQPDASDRAEEVARQMAAVRATAQLGGRLCRVLSGQRRPDVPRDRGIAWVAACIQEVLPVAEQEGVVLNLENHYKDGYWDYPEFAQRRDVFLDLLDAVGEHPNFGVNYDPSNAVVAGDDPIELLERVKHRVVSMHASDRYLDGGTLDDLRRMEAHPQSGYASILKHGVIGRGLNDYDRIFSLLREVGFDGWISIEDGQDPDVGMAHLAESAVFLRRKMGEYRIV
jgi:sugar phosphate isomerase/epimerase